MSDVIGQRLGDFQLQSLLGKGNTGTVYRAVRLSSGEPAAVKILHPHLMKHPGVHKRMLKQIEIAAALKHPGIAQIYQSGEKDGSIFIAMEFVLDGHICPPPARQPMPHDVTLLSTRLDLVRQVADTLVAAHSSNVW